MRKKVWFITGASKGFGAILVHELLTKGEFVAASSRFVNQFDTHLIENSNFLPVEIKNLSDFEEVSNAVQIIKKKFRQIDVLVNNAGYGQVGIFEETSDEKIRQNFEVHVFGLLNVIKAVLPIMRVQKFGKIVNFSSTAGFFGFPLSSIYVAAKHAVDGFSESLNHELNPLGIQVMSVLPGSFRTNFLSPGSLEWGDQNPIKDYDQLRDEQKEGLISGDKKQIGDPKKGMDVLIQVIESNNMPQHLTLGEDAYELREMKKNMLQEELDTWKILASNTNFENMN
ncbi:SDR family oxidoreductase [Carnobacterium maltaromaticum]|uniref:SDR family oxidoreductase n=1 Tax=Carnobacterium maltaromaticum TaxID=2751 RepID=UPI0039B0E76E